MQPGLESVIMHVDDPSALDRLALGDSFQTVPAALNASGSHTTCSMKYSYYPPGSFTQVPYQLFLGSLLK